MNDIGPVLPPKQAAVEDSSEEDSGEPEIDFRSFGRNLMKFLTPKKKKKKDDVNEGAGTSSNRN